MRRLALLLLVVFPGLLPAAPKEASRPKPLAITHVTVIDTAGGPVFDRNHLQLNSIAPGSGLSDSYFSASAATLSARRPSFA